MGTPGKMRPIRAGDLVRCAYPLTDDMQHLNMVGIAVKVSELPGSYMDQIIRVQFGGNKDYNYTWYRKELEIVDVEKQES